MPIEKRYKDIDAGWFRPGQERAIYQLSRRFDDVELVLKELRAGHIIQTTHALYRWVPDEETEDGQSGRPDTSDGDSGNPGGGMGVADNATDCGKVSE